MLTIIQDSSEDTCVCGGPARQQQDPDLSPPERDSLTPKRLQCRTGGGLRCIFGMHKSAVAPKLLISKNTQVRRNVQIFTGITEMKMNAQKNHEELLEMIAALSDRTTSDEGSSVGTEVLSQDSDNSS
jgi:hypothetical protein